MPKPTDVYAVNLEIQQWNAVLTVLAEGPFKTVAPLLQAIQEQCQEQERRAQEQDQPQSKLREV